MNWKLGFWELLKKTFGPDGIFSTGTEGHAFLIGISETVAFWKPRHDMPAEYGHEENEADGHPLKKEYHYYLFGRACGVLVWIGLIALLKAVIL